MFEVYEIRDGRLMLVGMFDHWPEDAPRLAYQAAEAWSRNNGQSIAPYLGWEIDLGDSEGDLFRFFASVALGDRDLMGPYPPDAYDAYEAELHMMEPGHWDDSVGHDEFEF